MSGRLEKAARESYTHLFVWYNVSISMGKMKSWVVTWQKLSQRYKAQDDFGGQGIPAVAVVQMDHQGRSGDWGWGKKSSGGQIIPKAGLPMSFGKPFLHPKKEPSRAAQGETQQHFGWETSLFLWSCSHLLESGGSGSRMQREEECGHCTAPLKGQACAVKWTWGWSLH